MEKTINRPAVNAGEKNNKRRNLIRAGVVAVGVTTGAVLIASGTSAGDSDPQARAVEAPAKVFIADGNRYKGFVLPKIFEEISETAAYKVEISTTTSTLPPTTTTTAPPRISYNAALWQDLHECEQPETWHAGGHFGNGLLSGGNGLGMSADAWEMAVEDAADRGVTLPSSGWEASIDQQMQAAQVFYEEEGWGWACHVGGH